MFSRNFGYWFVGGRLFCVNVLICVVGDRWFVIVGFFFGVMIVLVVGFRG